MWLVIQVIILAEEDNIRNETVNEVDVNLIRRYADSDFFYICN